MSEKERSIIKKMFSFHTISISMYEKSIQEWLSTIQKSCKYSTYVKYRGICDKYILPALQKPSGHKVSSNMMYLYPDQMSGLANSTKKSIASVTKEVSIFGIQQYNLLPLKLEIEYNAPQKEDLEIFTIAEQRKLIRYLYYNMNSKKLCILLGLTTGIRLGELCALKAGDFDIENGCLMIQRTVQRIAAENELSRTVLMITSPKSIHSNRTIPLPTDLLALLTECIPNDPDEFIWARNKPLDPRTCQNRFYQCLEECGIKKKNFHILRHTFATNCISNGMDVKCLSEILGHSDIKITMNKYVHPSLETKRQYMNSLSISYEQYLQQA